MPNELTITMTSRGFEVRLGTHVSQFPSVKDAVEFAQERLRYAVELRNLKAQID